MKDDDKTREQLLHELTELRMQNAALQKSESAEKYRSLVENIRDVIYELDSQGVVLYISPVIRDLLGYDSAEIVGKNFTEFAHKDDLSSLAEWFSDLRKGKEYPSEYRVIDKSGELRWARTNTKPIMEDGLFKGAHGILIDITIRKRAEEALRESEKKYRDLYDFLPIPVYEMDFEANITSVNRAIYETFRGTEEDFKKGFKAWQLLSPEEIEKSAKNIERLLIGEQIKGTEYNLMRLDGSVFPAIVISRVIYSDGKPVGLRGAIVDITERKQAEESLRESEERYKALFDRSLDLVYIHDFEGRFIDANDAALNRLGYTKEEIHSLNFTSLLSEDQLPIAFKTLQGIRETGIQKDLSELRLWHKDGTPVYVETQGSTVMSDGKPIAILQIARDITERKQAEKAMQESIESLRKAVSTTIQVLVSAVEIRDPYTAGHQIRSADLARSIASEIGLPQEKIDGIRLAGSIHDIGKLSIPAEILSKPTRLSEIEFMLIKEHARQGYEILKNVESPWPLAEIVYQHHERMDGSGYPRNLKGEEICMEARIIAVADVVEAMASHRPYRPAFGIDTALEEIEKNRGILYDAEVVDACLKLFWEKGFQLKGA